MWGFSHLALLRMERGTWRGLVRGLHDRGEGRRESGAFLLADASGDHRVVTSVVYFDDLDPACLKGHIHIVGTAFSKLWDICEEKGLRVTGDVHTHPGAAVAQSLTDAHSPAMARAGHVAIIVPNLAAGKVSPSSIGIHLYRGDAGWRSWFGRAAAVRLDLRRSL